MKCNLFFLLATFLLLILSFSCERTKPESVSTHILDAKQGPSEEFFLQRMDPDGNFALKAYTNGLKEAQNDAATPTRSINGFDNEWTVQGPGNLGGRVNTLAIDPKDENIIYAGFSLGGVFKTENAGQSWKPIFDDQIFSAIGDITIDPNNSNTVYVGTGDPNISGFPSIGDGIYKSEDAGDTWTHIGLTEQRIISEIIVDPRNSNRLFAATMGLPFARNNQRGLYRSDDQGDNWEQVLFLSESAGVSDIAINPSNPNIIYAAGWDRIRNNTESIVSGEEAKIYRSINGGDDWQLLEGGLPNSEINGRIGLSICNSSPNVIYAQYAGQDNFLGGIYRSDDFGTNWTSLSVDPNIVFSGSRPLGGFAWYFGKIRVNPNNPDDLYLLGIDLWRSQDGGTTWNLASPIWWTYEVHADKHDLVFLDDESILLGTDGGIYKSDKDNFAWEDLENIPTNKFYRTAYNPHRPDWYYGGAQDNGSTGGNADNINDWPRLFGGDGFQPAFDTDDPNRYFFETQNGNISATLDDGGIFERAMDGINQNDPVNWDMPYLISAYDNNKMILGTNRIYKSETRFPFWNVMSPDLTDGPAGTTRNGSITAIHESPVQEDLVFVGTGDGNVWKGDLANYGNFEKISDGLIDQYVTDVVGSYVDTERIFVTHSGYRDNDNLDRINRSDDGGQTWTDISSNLPEVAINELLIMPATGDSVMFIATDAGVYGTVDAATTWERLGTNMTIIPVYDLVYNEFKNELVAATFGRSIQSYDLTDILNPEDVEVSVFTPDNDAVERLKVFPNPAVDEISIAYTNIEPDRSSDIAIISADGKLIQLIEKVEGTNVLQLVDLSNLAPGNYYVKVKVRHSVLSAGFVKM